MSLPRKIIEFTHRERLEDKDVRFIAQTLGGENPREQEGVIQLLIDPEEKKTRDKLLDAPKLSEALGDETRFLNVSMSLFLYVNVRPFLKKFGVADPSVAAFVSANLAEAPRSQTQVEISEKVDRRLTPKQRWNLFKARRPYAYMVELSRRLRGVEGSRRFDELIKIGNEALFISGFCEQTVAARHASKIAPQKDYYERFAAANYEAAGKTDEAYRAGLEDTLGALSSRISEVSQALSSMRRDFENW